MRKFLVAGGLLAFAGCAPIPMAAPFPLTAQQKVQAADHWRVIADDVAARVAKTVSPGELPVYIARKPPSPFSRAFEAYLEAALFNKGYAMAGGPVGAATVDYGVQKVQHAANRDNRPPLGVLSAIGAAGAVGYGARDIGTDAAIGIGAPLLIATDLALGAWSATPTNAELVLSTAIIVNDRFVSREAATYYVNPADLAQYSETSIAMRRPGPPIETRAVTVAVRGDAP